MASVLRSGTVKPRSFWDAAAAEAMRLLVTYINDGPGAQLPLLTRMPVRLIPGDTAFTVPLFDQFMTRIMPGDDWRE